MFRSTILYYLLHYPWLDSWRLFMMSTQSSTKKATLDRQYWNMYINEQWCQNPLYSIQPTNINQNNQTTSLIHFLSIFLTHTLSPLVFWRLCRTKVLKGYIIKHVHRFKNDWNTLYHYYRAGSFCTWFCVLANTQTHAHVCLNLSQPPPQPTPPCHPSMN